MTVSVACGRCGGPSEVVETRAFGSATRRRRRCLAASCGSRFSTLEVRVPDCRPRLWRAVLAHVNDLGTALRRPPASGE